MPGGAWPGSVARMHKKLVVTTLFVIALLVAAAPASAKGKTKHYSGKTDSGNPMSFSMKGKRIFNIDGYVSAVCVPTRGTPRTGMTGFDPPGSFRLGRTRKTKKTEYISWWGDTTFHYKVSSKKRGRSWKVKLHVNYSYTQYTTPGGGQVNQVGYVCQGDDSFSFKP